MPGAAMTAMGRQWSFLQGFVFTESRLKCVQSQGILWSHPWHMGFPLWRLTICCRACCIISRAALDSLRIRIYSSCWNTCEHLWYFALCVSPWGEGRDSFLTDLIRTVSGMSEGCIYEDVGEVLDCTQTAWRTPACFGLSLTTFSLFSVTVIHSAWRHC